MGFRRRGTTTPEREIPKVCIVSLTFGISPALAGQFAGGGGGNRTPVREHSTRSIYRLRSGLYLVVSVAPDQARYNKPAGNISRKTPASAGFRQPDTCRRPGLSGVVPISATGSAVSAYLFLGSVSVVVIVVGNYCCCRFFTRPAAPRPATPVSTSPSKPVRPLIGNIAYTKPFMRDWQAQRT